MLCMFSEFHSETVKTLEIPKATWLKSINFTHLNQSTRVAELGFEIMKLRDLKITKKGQENSSKMKIVYEYKLVYTRR